MVFELAAAFPVTVQVKAQRGKASLPHGLAGGHGVGPVLVAAKAVPIQYRDDAMHIAFAAVAKMDYLVSWNFRHITNAQMIPKIKKVCADNGYVCAEICTPQMLQEEVQDDA